MKLKQCPEDFCVEEVSELKPAPEPGKHKLYSLKKRGLDTMAAISYISRHSRIPSSDFGVAGLKDRHALAVQNFTIPSKHELADFSEKSFSVKFLGFVNSPVKIGGLTGNRFKIIVRGLLLYEIKRLNESAGDVGWLGVPNYFDSQRFGSVINGEFIAKHVVKKNYEAAVKIYLTGYTKSESLQKKEEKRRLLEGWGNLAAIEVKNPLFAKIISQYKRAGWLEAYKAIPHKMRELFVSAYQSYLWNECVKEVVKDVMHGSVFSVKYSAGLLSFFKGVDKAKVELLPKTFRMVAPRSSYPESELAVINKVLIREGVALKDFDIQKDTQNFFMWYERPLLLVPKGLAVGTPEPDELNQNARKLTIGFELPKGSYATVVLKGLFGK